MFGESSGQLAQSVVKIEGVLTPRNRVSTVAERNSGAHNDEIPHSSGAVGAGNVVAHGNNSNVPSKIFASTFNGPSTSAGFGSSYISNIFSPIDLSSGTRRIIADILAEGDENAPPTSQPAPATASQTWSGSQPFGSMEPNISAPENMIDEADRELIKIFHTV